MRSELMAKKIEINPSVNFIDLDRTNNVWPRELEEENGVENTSSNIKNTKLSHSNIEDYTGNYYNAAYGNFEVFAKNDSLFLHTTDKTRQYYLNHNHYDTFGVFNIEDGKVNMSWIEFEINFRTNIDGDISEAMLEMESTLDAIAFKHIPKIISLNASNLKQYIGEYEVGGTTLRVYTKENDTSLYLFISDDQPEFELSATGEHKFSFEMSGVELRVEFENPGNGVFKELIFIQPDGSFKAIRK